jgi:hypothetical protein
VVDHLADQVRELYEPGLPLSQQRRGDTPVYTASERVPDPSPSRFIGSGSLGSFLLCGLSLQRTSAALGRSDRLDRAQLGPVLARSARMKTW